MTWSGFRLWRDERKIEEFEGALLRGIASYIRDQIESLHGQRYRRFVWAQNPDDRAHHEKMYRKHLPDVDRAINAWVQNPDDQDTASFNVTAAISEGMPNDVPTRLRNSVNSAIHSYIKESLMHSVAPPGRFGVSEFQRFVFSNRDGMGASVLSHLPHNEGPTSVKEAEKLAEVLNLYCIEVWNSPDAQHWRGLQREDEKLKERVKSAVTKQIFRARFPRKYCDKDCYD